MKWVSTLSEEPELAVALAEVIANTGEALDGLRPDLVVFFVSGHHAEHYDALAKSLAQTWGDSMLLGCSAGSVIGGEREVEDRPGLALSAALLPGVTIHPFHLEVGELPDPGDDPARWAELVGAKRSDSPDFILLGDPFSSDPERLAAGLDTCFPESVKIGGIASGGTEPGSNALFLGRRVHRTGVVGIGLSGNVSVEAIVAQGCRPVGNPMFVTRCQDNVLYSIDDRPAIEVVSQLYAAASPEDQELFRSSLFLGIEMRSSQMEYHQGDFLVRNLVGGDDESGALSVAAPLHEGQVVQFHLRDATTAHDDLEEHLKRAGPYAASARGALLFSCLGRGQHLFGEADHDSRLFRNHLGRIPLSGFFGNGEIGPVQQRTFLHGYTSAFGIFRTRDSH